MKLLTYDIFTAFGIQLKCATSCAVRNITHTLLEEPVFQQNPCTNTHATLTIVLSATIAKLCIFN